MYQAWGQRLRLGDKLTQRSILRSLNSTKSTRNTRRRTQLRQVAVLVVLCKVTQSVLAPASWAMELPNSKEGCFGWTGHRKQVRSVEKRDSMHARVQERGRNVLRLSSDKDHGGNSPAKSGSQRPCCSRLIRQAVERRVLAPELPSVNEQEPIAPSGPQRTPRSRSRKECLPRP